jgi:hypothetical protein
MGVASLAGCRSAAPGKRESAVRPEAPLEERFAPGGETPQPLGRSPEPVGPKPGQGCRQVTLAPPCTLSLFVASPAATRGDGPVPFIVRYRDSQGREVAPYFLQARREDQPALERFFRDEKNRVVSCQGGWTSAPCNDTPRVSGFPEPPVGTVTRR